MTLCTNKIIRFIKVTLPILRVFLNDIWTPSDYILLFINYLLNEIVLLLFFLPSFFPSFLNFTPVSSVQLLSRIQLFVIPWTAACQASLSITNFQSLLKLRPLSQWCQPTISSSVVPFSSCLQSFSVSGSFQMRQFFASGGQSIRVSASASILLMYIEDWFPLGWTGLISL